MLGVDISEVSKVSFKAYTFKDDSIYYGETAHLDEDGNIIIDIEKVSDEKLRTLKLIRHGFGVQLYGVDKLNCLCKYEGQWFKDIRTGKGICYFSDKSTYEGSLLNNLFHGFGKFTWANNDIYIGEWKQGKMEGEGEFKHNDGHILKGYFRNNYYLDQDENGVCFVNPFLDQSALHVVKSSTKNCLYKKSTYKIKLCDDYFSSAFFKDYDAISSKINTIIEGNKTPLILKSPKLSKKEIINSIEQATKSRVIELDLREFHSIIEGVEYNVQELKNLEKKVEICIFTGAVFFLNFDDNSAYDKLFDPELSNYYKKMQLSPLMFTPQDFKETTNYKRFTRQEKSKREKPISPSFKFIVYSNFHVGTTQSDDKLYELECLKKIKVLIEKRFNKAFNLSSIKVIMLTEEEKGGQ